MSGVRVHASPAFSPAVRIELARRGFRYIAAGPARKIGSTKPPDAQPVRGNSVSRNNPVHVSDVYFQEAPTTVGAYGEFVAAQAGMAQHVLKITRKSGTIDIVNVEGLLPADDLSAYIEKIGTSRLLGATGVCVVQNPLLMQHGMPALDAAFAVATHPIVNVTWFDAAAYSQWLGQRLSAETGLALEGRLPTEIEWEKAARGPRGFPYGTHSGELRPGEAHYSIRDTRELWNTQPVRQFQPNGFELYDMTGSVWEWCADWYHEHTYRTMADYDPRGPETGDWKVLRGGSWNSAHFVNLLAAYRHYDFPGDRGFDFGFRPVLVAAAQDSIT